MKRRVMDWLREELDGQDPAQVDWPSVYDRAVLEGVTSGRYDSFVCNYAGPWCRRRGTSAPSQVRPTDQPRRSTGIYEAALRSDYREQGVWFVAREHRGQVRVAMSLVVPEDAVDELEEAWEGFLRLTEPALAG